MTPSCLFSSHQLLENHAAQILELMEAVFSLDTLAQYTEKARVRSKPVSNALCMRQLLRHICRASNECSKGHQQTTSSQRTLFLRLISEVYFTLMMETVCVSETFVTIYQTARRCISKQHEVIYKHLLGPKSQVSNTE
jgi:hypothetical protein